MENTRKLWKFIIPYKMSFFSLFICVFSTSFIGSFYPYIFSILIDEVFYHRNMNFFLIIVICYGTLYIGEALLHLVLNTVWAYLMTRFLFDIRSLMFEKILHIKTDYFHDIHTGDLIARINKDTNEVMEFIHRNIFFALSNSIKFIISIAFVAFLNIRIAIFLLIATPITVYISIYFSKKINTIAKAYREKYGRYISWAFEILSSIREIRLLAAERNIIRKFSNFYSNIVRLKIKSSVINVTSERLNTFIVLFFELCFYVLAGIFIVKGELTVGGFVACIEYFKNASGLLKYINNVSITIPNRMVSMDKIFSLLQEESEQQDKKAIDIIMPKGQIEYSQVSFRYNNQNEVLKNICLLINEGERISLVGKSGAGKSTFANLLLRFYQPLSGAIKIDGMDIRNVSLKSLRKNIGIVQQETLLFDGTIKYNLKLGNSGCSEEQIMEACEKAHIASFIGSLHQGLDTVIGTDGINLSGGQRQRIAIARIFLKNPKILILDEATSALDYEAEQIIQKSWKELSTGRTTIVIAHRLSTILDSDRVAVLHDGEIISCGYHYDLLKNCVHYQALFKEQYIVQGETV